MTNAQHNQHRRRGMHPMRDFQALAADLARFDFSTGAGAATFYAHAVKNWTAGEVISMWDRWPRMTSDDPATTSRAKATLDELRTIVLGEMRDAAGRGYLGAKRTHGNAMTEGAERLLEKTIDELQAGRKPRNPHPRKRNGPDGMAVTKTEAAKALNVSRQTIHNLLNDPSNACGLLPAHLTSWKAFRVFLDANATRITANGTRQRKHRPDVRLTRTGRTEDAPNATTSS